MRYTRERLVLVVDALGRGSLGMCSEALATPEKVVVGTRPGRYPVNWPLLARVGMPQGRAPGGGNTVARGSREATSPWVFPT